MQTRVYGRAQGGVMTARTSEWVLRIELAMRFSKPYGFLCVFFGPLFRGQILRRRHGSGKEPAPRYFSAMGTSGRGNCLRFPIPPVVAVGTPYLHPWDRPTQHCLMPPKDDAIQTTNHGILTFVENPESAFRAVCTCSFRWHGPTRVCTGIWERATFYFHSLG